MSVLTFFAAITLFIAGSISGSPPLSASPVATPALEDRIRRVENGLPPVSLGENEPPYQLTLAKLMEMYNVPGLSIAVIDNFKIAWAKGYGVTEAGGHTPVTTRTLFQAGSVSKPVAAIATMSLVQQGELSLDQDVNVKLKSWKVPENEFTKDQKITLRRILSHTTGLTVHGFGGYAVDEPVPTLVQILNGEKPANNVPVRVEFAPGSKWRYSGGGTMIEQQLLIDVTGKPFPRILQQAVFDKLGLKDSTYEQPLPAARVPFAATGTYAQGGSVRGRWHVYPEMAAGGLWTTASDLAKIAIEIALSKQGKANHVLSQATVREMLRPQVERVGEIALGNKEHVDRMGLGFFLGDAAHPDLFGHIGDDEGFQAMLMMYGDSGKGVAVLANSGNGILLGDYLIQNIAKEYGWDYASPDRPHIGAPALLRAVEQAKGVPAALRIYEKLKKEKSPSYVVNENTLINFGYVLFAGNKLRDAIEVMKLAVQEYPDYWNAYDSLGELYAYEGEKQLAIQNYEKALALNPGNGSSTEGLKKLKEEK